MQSAIKIFCLLLFWVIPSSLGACENVNLKIQYNGNFSDLQVEIADDYLSRKKGLMFRDKLDASSGMLFIYESPRAVKFWMKNTSIPLDIAFADSKGEVKQVVLGTKPFSTDFIDGGANVQYVLEINAGMSKQFNLVVGSKILFQIQDRERKKNC